MPKDNKVNEEAEAEVKPGQTTIPFAQFLDMIKPAFPPQATKQDIMAYLLDRELESGSLCPQGRHQ